jgi:hypothetical protein
MIRRALASAAPLGALLALASAASAALPTTTPEPLLPTTNGVVTAEAISGSTLYIGGSFTQVLPPGGAPVARNGLAAIDLNTGQVESFDVGLPILSGVDAIAVGDGLVYVGGFFDGMVQGTSVQSLLAVDPATGALSSYHPAVSNGGADGTVDAILPAAGHVYIGGQFDSIAGTARTSLADTDPATGAPSTFNANLGPAAGTAATTPTVRALDLVSSSTLWVGGNFAKVNNNGNYGCLAAIDTGSSLPLKTTNVTGVCVSPTAGPYALGVAGGQLYAGGAFGLFRFGEFTGAEDMAFDPLTNPTTVRSMALTADGVFIAGDFTSVDGAPADHLAALSLTDGSRLGFAPTLDTTTSPYVPALAASASGSVFAGDYHFTTGDPHNYFVGFDSGPANSAAPAISGTATPGNALRCSNGTWSGDFLAYTYAWARDGTPIPGTGANTYAVTAADVGHALTCTVTASNTGGAQSASATSGPVQPTAGAGGGGGGGPSNAFTIAGHKTTKHGSLVFTLQAPGAGTFVAAAKTTVSVVVKRHHNHRVITFGHVSAAANTAGPAIVTIAPSRAARQRLLAGARLRVLVAITFTPGGGTPRTLTSVAFVRLRSATRR